MVIKKQSSEKSEEKKHLEFIKETKNIINVSYDLNYKNLRKKLCEFKNKWKIKITFKNNINFEGFKKFCNPFRKLWNIYCKIWNKYVNRMEEI